MTNSINNSTANLLAMAEAMAATAKASAEETASKQVTGGNSMPPAKDSKTPDSSPSSSTLPRMSSTTTPLPASDFLVGVPSMGAGMLALMAEFSADQRKQNADQRALQTEMIVSTLQDQAKNMQNKAVAQLCIGIATGVVSIAQGAISGGLMIKGTVANSKIDNAAARQTADMLLNTKNQVLNSSMGGLAQTMGSINQAVGGFFDADLKMSDANIEQLRSMSDALRSLEESFKEVIQKSLSVQEAIQQNTNQTRTKILG